MIVILIYFNKIYTINNCYDNNCPQSTALQKGEKIQKFD